MSSANSAADYQKVKNVFIAALDAAPEKRAAFLDATCASKDVRREVESLLKARDEAGEFLQNVSAVEVVQDSIDKNDRFIGQTIDKYLVEREIGRGGMGAVYLATRNAGDFQKRVAIKIIKRGADTGEALKRFGQERRILAALEHPNIARLIDGGTNSDGVPYLMMEYVEGFPIDVFCARHNLSVEEKLRLFQKICAAVAHAHRNLTIHRDLKSSNILVAADSEPKLLDFGIAKLFSDGNSQTNNETLTNSRALTPEYASPEQLRGERLTTATDVYSLGVILYELLTGTRPFATGGKNYAEVLQIVSEIQPTRPSLATAGKSSPLIKQRKINGERRTNLIDGDLDNIVLKSLNKEPERRYGSVEQFCEDIEKYLKGLPVSARKDSFSYRFSKFVKRNPLASAISVLLILSLLGGFAVTLWQYRKAQTAQARAERRFDDVRGLSNSMLFELNDTIEKGPTAARAMIVQRASEYLDKLNQESDGDVSLRLDLAAAYIKVGDLQGRPFAPNLGDMNGALESYRKAADLIESLMRLDSSNLAFISKSADVRQRIGEIYTVQMNRVEALQNFTEVMRLREKVLSVEPQNQDFRREEADAEMRMGDVLQIGGDESAIVDYPAVLERYRRARAVFEDLADQQAAYCSKERFTAASIEQRTGLALVRFAQQSKNKEKEREAIERYAHVLSVIEKFAAAEPSNLTYRRVSAGVRGSLAEVQTDIGDFPAALDNYRQIESIAESAAERDTANIEPRINLASFYVSYGETLGKSGSSPQAVEKIRRGVKIAESLMLEAGGAARAEDIYRSLIDGYFALGAEAEKVKNFQDSSVSYRKSLEYCDKLLSIDALHEETLQKKSLLVAKIK